MSLLSTYVSLFSSKKS